MKKNVTYKQLIAFSRVSQAYLKNNANKDNKLSAAIQSIHRQIRKQEIFEDYNDQLQQNQLQHCLTDEATGAILKDADGSFRFNAEGFRATAKFAKELLKKTVQIEALIFAGTEDLIKQLSDYEIEVFEGLIIEKQPDPSAESTEIAKTQAAKKPAAKK